MNLNLHPKVAAGALASAVAALVVWAASYWVVVPAEVGVALTTLLAFAAGYLTPSTSAP